MCFCSSLLIKNTGSRDNAFFTQTTLITKLDYNLVLRMTTLSFKEPSSMEEFVEYYNVGGSTIVKESDVSIQKVEKGSRGEEKGI